jgi:hypothetical protein
MDLLLEYGKIAWTYMYRLEYIKIPWTYFESTKRCHGTTSRVRKDAMELLREYGKMPGTYFDR